MKKIYLKLMALALLSVLCVTNAWAWDCGWFETGAAGLTFSADGVSKSPSNLNRDDNNVSDYDLGTITTSLQITTAWGKIWGQNNVNTMYLYYRLKEQDEASDDEYSSAALEWDNNFDTNNQYWDWGGKDGTSAVLATININLAPGDYEIEYYFKLNPGSNHYCEKEYLSNNSKNYHANFTIPSKNLTVAGADVYGNTVSGNQTGITKGTAYTITATANTGYAFLNWTTSDSHITIDDATSATTTVTFNDYSDDATVTAHFEPGHNVTVSYKCGVMTIADDAVVENVGETTPKSVSAADINDHTFSSWSAGDGITTNSATGSSPISINTKASGSYTLTANYTLIPCNVLKANKAKNADVLTDLGAMSYDADVDAYYKDVTTDAEPFYFRLKYNNDNNSIYCSDWKSKNGTDAYTSGKEIIVNSETKIDCNNEIHGWTDKPAMYTNAVNGSTIRIWFDYQHKKTWITETTYTVTLANDGHGSVDVASVTAGKNTLSDEFTATPSDGYEFDSWEVTTGGANITLTSTTDNPTTVKATSTGTVRANFSALHYDVTLNANGGTGDDVTVEAIYDDDMPTEDKSSKDLVAPTKTGYDFAGYYDDADEGEGTQYYDEDLNSASIWDKASTATLYAHWTAKDYTVTLDKQSGATGYSDAGDIPNQTVTYNDDLPTITGTVPIGATGYKFVGFYTAASGGGVKVINADKSWVDDASITEDEVTTTYTEDGKWVYAGDVTLYAYYQNAEIATLPLSALMVHPWVSGETMDSITVTPTLTFAPEPTVLICYEIQYSDGSSVTDDGLQTFRNLGSNSIRFRAPKNPGSYRVKAQLKQNDCDGAVLDTKYSEFAVAGNYSVTVKYVCDGKAIRDQEVLTINSLDSTSVTAPAIARYTFARWSATEGITSNTSDNVNPKKYVASFDGTITATYVEKPIVYFKDNLGWGDVWVTYDASWNDSYGTGSSGKTYRHMQKLEGTDDIWYDEIPSTYTDNSFANWPWNIAFNSQEIHETYFNTGKAIFRRDFDPYNTFFVPAPDSIVSPYTKSGATYQSSYCDHYKDGVGNNYLYPGGYWKRYNSTYSGWSLRGSFNSWAGSNHNFIAESSDDSIFTTSVLLYKNNNNYFRLYKNKMKNGISDAYTNYGYDITLQNSETARRFTPPSNESSDKYNHNKNVLSATEGVYVFKIHYTYKGTVELTIDFPMHAGDYEVAYKDDLKTAWHSSGTIDRNATESTRSFFVRTDKNPVISWRKSSAITDAGAITWGDWNPVSLTSYTASGKILASNAEKNGVYNFKFDIADNTLSLTDIEKYSGAYYIRTDAAGGKKWADYISDDHYMTYSDYADAHSGFSHYFMKYVGAGTNVKFLVANPYSPCISDTLGQGTQSDYVNGSDNLIASANIRFMWNMHDNSVDRAYVGMVDRTHTPRQATKFIVLQGQADMLLDSVGNPLNSENQGTMYVGDNAIEFDDDEDWVYETTVKAKADGRIKLYSEVNGHDYYLIGGAPLNGSGAWELANSDYLITGTGATAQKIRVIYDFKTGRLITAWLPSDEVNTAMTVKADVMIVREHQEAAEQINMNSSGRIQLTDGKTVYGVMRFNKYVLNNLEKGTSTPLPEVSRKTVNELSNYYISFPFDVKVSDIFGFGSYGPDWTLRYYDGKGRAKNGYWADSNSFWKYVPPFGTLNANEGYLLSLNMNNFTTSSDVWNNGVENIELYFPATGTINIQQVASVDIDSLKVSEYQSTINRGEGTDGDRRIADSFWRCIGVPSFAAKTVNYNDAGTYAMNWHTDTDDGLPFLYKVNWNTNDLDVQDATSFTFQPMHAYMVQNGNLIRWTNVIRPASVAQRAVELEELTFRLELNKNDVKEDQTYIRLTDKETVTSAFDFGQDLSKEFRNDVNIYTMIGYEKAAANSMPFSESTIVIPMGVKMSESGEYTFAMPDGTHGVSVILIDNIAGTRTNLGLLDYTAYLEAGQTDGRFSLEIAPIQQMPTDIEAVSDQHSAVRKVMIDGILYIVKDGKVFDARGAVVK